MPPSPAELYIITLLDEIDKQVTKQFYKALNWEIESCARIAESCKNKTIAARIRNRKVKSLSQITFSRTTDPPQAPPTQD